MNNRTSTFISVHMETAQGEFVHAASIPWFLTHPDVLVWGQRVFQRQGEPRNPNPPIKYREVFYFIVPVPNEKAPA